ncbi:MAG: c-type cytochrome [Hymenobacteraceae bacterium]|nr:c-type cytochrome [Hymenobacteraceae bacterium]
MKKTLMILGCCALLAACDSGDKSTTDESEKQYESADTDSAAAAAVSASNRQSEVDTNITNIGTDRTAGVATANVEKGEKLIAQSDCLACHKVGEKLVGPSYKEVAQKYENNDKNVDYLAGKIIEGGSGVWGQVPMTPHPNISKEDAREMARYILSLK